MCLEYIEKEEQETDIITIDLPAPRNAKLCALVNFSLMIMVGMMCVSVRFIDVYCSLS